MDDTSATSGKTSTRALFGFASAQLQVALSGSNPGSLNSDRRGGDLSATTPLRASGSAAEIGTYEIQQTDIIFGSEFETCPN
jgi:hypothetical protein